MEGGDGGGDGDGVGGVDWGQLHADFLELVLERAGWQEAVAASAVCWHWRATSKQDNLWRKYCERDYPDYAERHRQDPGWLTDWRTVFIAAHSSPGDNVQQHRKHHPTESCTLLPRSDADKRVLDVCFCGADCVVSACWGGGGELELHVWNLLDDSCSSIACGRLREDVGRSKPIVRLYWNGELLLVAVLSCSEVNHVEIYETPSSIVLAVHGDTVLLFHQVHHKLGLWRMDLNEYKELAVDVGDFLPLSVHLDSRGHPVPSGMINAAVVEVATACNDDTNHNIISVLSTTTQECFLEVKDLICLEHELNQLALLPMALAVIVTSLRTIKIVYTIDCMKRISMHTMKAAVIIPAMPSAPSTRHQDNDNNDETAPMRVLMTSQ
eukprot:jgi/Chlat1/5921/Chrsp4S06404